MTSSRLLVVDDHPVVLEGIRGLLARASDLEVVAEARSGREAVAAARREHPDIVILDLRLSDGLAPDLCRELRAVIPEARVVIFTAYDDRPPLLACLAEGAAAILLKDVRDLDLVQALRKVRAGATIVDERIAHQPSERASEILDDEGLYGPLTGREYEVLRLLARGMTIREIAEMLHLAINTVRSYSQSLLTKLHAHNRVQALATAKRLHLI